MAKKRAGWERMLYYGPVGSTAGTVVSDNVTDIDFKTANEFHETTDRGDGSAVPKKTEQLHCVGVELSWKMIYKDADTNVGIFLAAAEVGTIKAIKILRYSGGDTEFDGDCYLDYDCPGPLKDGMQVTFTAHATDDGGRDWLFS